MINWNEPKDGKTNINKSDWLHCTTAQCVPTEEFVCQWHRCKVGIHVNTMSLVENTSILTKREDCFCCCVILPIIRGDSISLTWTHTCVHFEMNQVPNVGVRNLKNFDVVLIGFSWIKLFELKTASPWTASFIDRNVLARIECCFELCITHINEWL